MNDNFINVNSPTESRYCDICGHTGWVNTPFYKEGIMNRQRCECNPIMQVTKQQLDKVREESEVDLEPECNPCTCDAGLSRCVCTTTFDEDLDLLRNKVRLEYSKICEEQITPDWYSVLCVKADVIQKMGLSEFKQLIEDWELGQAVRTHFKQGSTQMLLRSDVDRYLRE